MVIGGRRSDEEVARGIPVQGAGVILAGCSNTLRFATDSIRETEPVLYRYDREGECSMVEKWMMAGLTMLPALLVTPSWAEEVAQVQAAVAPVAAMTINKGDHRAFC